MEENAARAGDNEALLQELVLRLLAPAADPRTLNPQLFVGRLPDALPGDLPLPADSRLVGSLQRNSNSVQVVFDTLLPEQEVLAFYQERLSAAGWQEEDALVGTKQGGFVHIRSGRIGVRSLWYQGARGLTLYMQAFPGQGGRTDVWLNLDLSDNAAATRYRMHQRQRMGLDFLPPLLPPGGATQMDGGRGSTNDSYYSSATLEAADDLTTLSAHYASQFEQAGWTRTDGGQSGPVAWHTWTFQDEDGEPWRGMFLILKMPEAEDQCFVYLKADWANKGESTGSGGVSFTSLSPSR